LPKILGELVYALEYRNSEINLPISLEHRNNDINPPKSLEHGNSEVNLPKSNEKFVIPKNVYIIGTMNSADKSIGHIDVAIRRRFALIYKGPDSSVVSKEWENIDKNYGNELKDLLDKLNIKIREASKNSGMFVDVNEVGIGHSYFLPPENCKNTEEAKKYVEDKWRYFVLPLLKEYAFQFGGIDDKYFNENLEKVIEEVIRKING